ncbi:AMP-binding protein [Dactylosporangium sp. NPDC005572]|uniref:AMP-binding protein n=1 Tax=Dactylosporangium sp. NPDC005572 TaxID=3156889 RepID=UPI0033A2FE57
MSEHHVPDLLLFGVRRTPDKVCVAQGDASLTFAQVHGRAGRAGAVLQAHGVRRGDRVALLAANELQFLELQVACQRIGAAFVPVNFRLARPEIEALVADCRPVVMIHGPGYGAAADGLDIPHTLHLGQDGVGTSYDAALAAQSSSPHDIGMLPADGIAQIPYTSGTTGRAKGAIVRNSALFGRVSALMATMAIQRDDVFLQTLPLFHLASTVSFAYTAAGASCITLANFEPTHTLRIIERGQVTHTLVVPTIIDALARTVPICDADLSSLRTVFYGASPIPASMLSNALATLPCGFAQLYGMTEAGIAVMLPPEDHNPQTKPGLLSAAGRDVMFYRTRVVRPDGTACAPGEFGEITMAGPGLFDGYWNAPEATAQTLRAGQMSTGDGGYVDEAGYLYLTDRIKDMIITGGENVFCPEVEAVLAAHPAVTEVAVIGLPDATWGQRVHAVLVTAPGADTTPEDLDAWCRERLAGYKRPRSYEFVAALPRNAVGKILKRELRVDVEAL